MKQANHYFRSPVGDELRMFRGVSLDAIGLFVWLRLYTFDNEPSGFLVDQYHRPLAMKRLADTIGEKNARCENLFTELRQARLVQSVPEYTALLARAADRGRRAARKRDYFVEMLRDVWPAQPTSLDDVYLVAQLVDQALETAYGKKTGALGGNDDLIKDEGAEVVNHVDNHQEPGVDNHVVKAQSQRSEVRVLKKETPARVREEVFPSDARMDWLLEQCRQFLEDPIVAEMAHNDPDEYVAAFARKVGGYTPTEFEMLRERWSRRRISACVVRFPAARARVAERLMSQLALPLGGN